MVRWNKAYIQGTRNIVSVDNNLPEDTKFECMSCHQAMIRRRGQKRVHHFAHNETTINCDPEGYFHKLGKRIFKELYDKSSEFIIHPSSGIIDLKKEYGECFIEIKEEGKVLKRNADLYIKHLKDESKDISVEIFFSHQVTKRKIDSGYRIIEIRLPISISSQDDTDSDKIESLIRTVCTAPLKECDENIRFYNFEDTITYHEIPSSSGLYRNYSINEQDCLGTDLCRRSVPKFKNYIPHSHNNGDNGTINNRNNIDSFPKIETDIQKHESSILKQLLEKPTKPTKQINKWDVDIFIKNKYPNIRHQPAVLPNCIKTIDIIVKDDNKEYWFGIYYNKNEIIKGDFDRKIPIEWKEAVREYILNLKPIYD